MTSRTACSRVMAAASRIGRRRAAPEIEIPGTTDRAYCGLLSQKSSGDVVGIPVRLSGVIATDRLLAFVATAFALIVVPGPSVLFVISRGVALGRRAALATVV